MNVIRFLPLIYWVVNVLMVIFDTASDGKGEQAGCTGEGEARTEGCFEKLNQAMGRSGRQNNWWCCPSLTEWTWARTQLDSVIASNTAGKVGGIWSREETHGTPAQFCHFPQSILLLHVQVLSKPHSEIFWNLLCHGPLAPLLLAVIPSGIFFPTKGLTNYGYTHFSIQSAEFSKHRSHTMYPSILSLSERLSKTRGPVNIQGS